MGSPSPHAGAALVEDLPLRVGEMVAGKYRIGRVLGVGGMGAVVLAHHVQLDQPMALKLMLPAAAKIPEAAERFLREARAAVRLQSENVCRVFDVGALPGGEPYMVMEYLEGVDLAELLTAQKRISLDDAVDYIRQVCRALAEAHAIGIVHRDLKPRNLFLAKRPGGPAIVKVLDFGISKIGGERAERSITSTNSMLGTPHYMAPEQMLSTKSADARADIWSLGICLYELLSGAVPFDGDTLAEITIRVCQQPPPHITTIAPWVPSEIARVVHHCLEKRPEDRIASASALSEALTAALVGVVESKRDLESARTVSAAAPKFADAKTDGAMEAPSRNFHQPPRRRRTWPFVVIAAVALLGAGGGLLLYMRGVRLAARLPPASTQAAAPSPPAPSASVVEAPPHAASATTAEPKASTAPSQAAAPTARPPEGRRGPRPTPRAPTAKPGSTSDLPMER